MSRRDRRLALSGACLGVALPLGVVGFAGEPEALVVAALSFAVGAAGVAYWSRQPRP